MNDLPPQPTPQQSYGQQDSQQSHHSSVNRKHPSQSHQIPQKVSYRPPPQQQQVPPQQQQYQQYSSSPRQEYYQKPPAQNYPQPGGHYAPVQQYSNQQPQAPPSSGVPVQQYVNQQPPANYQHRPSYSLPTPTQQHIYQQQQQPQQQPPPQQQQYQAPPINNGNYSKRNASKDSFESSKTSSSSKQKLESELRIVFEKVDTNRSGRISAVELSYALLNFDRTRFQDSTIRLMINLFSTPESSSKSLTFEQFVSLWKYLSSYKKLFIQADANKSGDLSFGEFQKILEQIGYKLDIDLVLHLFQKYSMHDNGSVGKLKFDNFIELLVYLRRLTDIFRKYDTDSSGTATISFSSFLFEVSNLN